MEVTVQPGERENPPPLAILISRRPVGKFPLHPPGLTIARQQEASDGCRTSYTIPPRLQRHEYPDAGSIRIGGNLVERPPERLGRIAFALIIDAKPVAHLDGPVWVVDHPGRCPSPTRLSPPRLQR